jgi:hypothetical protein
MRAAKFITRAEDANMEINSAFCDVNTTLILTTERHIAFKVPSSAKISLFNLTKIIIFQFGPIIFDIDLQLQIMFREFQGWKKSKQKGVLENLHNSNIFAKFMESQSDVLSPS